MLTYHIWNRRNVIPKFNFKMKRKLHLNNAWEIIEQRTNRNRAIFMQNDTFALLSMNFSYDFIIFFLFFFWFVCLRDTEQISKEHCTTNVNRYCITCLQNIFLSSIISTNYLYHYNSIQYSKFAKIVDIDRLIK